MDKNIELFLQEGLNRYSEAVSTIEFFQNEIQSLLKKIKIFHKIDNVRSGGNNKEHWIYTTAKELIHDDIQAEIEFGIWWNPSEVDKKIILYAYLRDTDVRSFEYSDKDKRVFQIEGDKKKTRLYIVPEDDPKLIDDFELLLSVLLRNVKKEALRIYGSKR